MKGDSEIRAQLHALTREPWFELIIADLAQEIPENEVNEFTVLNAAALWIQRNVDPTSAQEALAKLFLGRPMLILSRMLPQADAEDVASRALLEFLRKWPTESQRPKANATYLLRLIAMNRARDAIRRQNRQRTEPLDDETAGRVDPSAQTHEAPQFSDEMIAALNECIQALPQPERELIADFHINGLDYQGIARLHGLTEEAVRQRTSRIRRLKLKPCIESKLPAA
ncbi:RNA polymerase sigma factor [Prosthecobacter sp.]|uniref:RNA polymerase sigma factor n=1 Tax=Prosthecobacter sp. TaxID=1965333 RepID=UPI0037842321